MRFVGTQMLGPATSDRCGVSLADLTSELPGSPGPFGWPQGWAVQWADGPLEAETRSRPLDT